MKNVKKLKIVQIWKMLKFKKYSNLRNVKNLKNVQIWKTSNSTEYTSKQDLEFHCFLDSTDEYRAHPNSNYGIPLKSLIWYSIANSIRRRIPCNQTQHLVFLSDFDYIFWIKNEGRIPHGVSVLSLEAIWWDQTGSC